MAGHPLAALVGVDNELQPPFKVRVSQANATEFEIVPYVVWPCQHFPLGSSTAGSVDTDLMQPVEYGRAQLRAHVLHWRVRGSTEYLGSTAKYSIRAYI